MKPSEPTAPAVAAPHSPTEADPPSPGLVRSAGLVGLGTMTSRLLGLVRNLTFAYFFGATNAMDAFFVAYRIPNLMRDLFAEGVMSAAFVPTFTKRLATKGRDSAWQLGNQLINALIVITGGLVLAGIIFVVPLTRLFAGDFGTVPGKFELTVQLTRVMLPFLTLVAIAAACMGMLNSLHRFFTPAVSPAMLNVCVIASAWAFVPLMPRVGFEPIMAIAFGFVLGGVAQVAVQYPSLRREGFRYRPTLNLKDRGLRNILGLMGPGTLAGAALQINVLINTILATGEGTGAVSWLTYAFQLMYVPIGLVGVSIATAALPVMSRHAALDDLPMVRRTLSRALRLMLVLAVPATVGLVVLAEPIARLIYERGNFTPADTQATALALVCYAPCVIGYSAVRLLVPSFYALGRSLTPAIVSMAAVGLNITLNLVLVRVIGYQGLALGTAVASLANAGFLLVLLRRPLGGVDGQRVAATLAKITVAAAVMGFVVSTADQWSQSIWPGVDSGWLIVLVGTEIVVGLAVLAAAARALKIAEIDEVLVQVGKRLRRNP